MSYKFSKGSQVIGDLKAADDTQRDTLIDFGEDQIDFQTSGSVRMQINNTGVDVQGDLGITGDVLIEGNDLNIGDFTGQADLYLNSGTSGSRILLRGTGDSMSAGDNIGAIYFDATEDDGNTLASAAWIIAEPTSTTYVVGSDMPSRLKFAVTRNNSSSPSDVLYIDGSQTVGRVGILDSTPSYTLDVNGDVRVQDDLFVDDFARIDALRVGTTSTDPGDGNLYVEGDVTIGGTVAASGMPGYILTYRSWSNAANENITITTGAVQYIDGSTNGKANITFVAPPTGNVELELHVYVEQASAGANLLMALSTDGTNFTTQAASYHRVFDGDETDDGVITVKWVLTGLTGGDSYQYWFGALTTSSNGIILRWGDGGLSSAQYPPLILKATTLPSSIS